MVDDEHEARALMAVILEREGFRIIEAADAVEADKQWHRVGKIDLLLTDLWMPGLSGFDLAVLMRYRQPELKVVFVSGLNPRPTTKEFGLMANAPLLTKPFTREQLISAVRQALNETK
jgi:two-component system cell cycle sensor histidine kinase/response regulator CckA